MKCRYFIIILLVTLTMSSCAFLARQSILEKNKTTLTGNHEKICSQIKINGQPFWVELAYNGKLLAFGPIIPFIPTSMYWGNKVNLISFIIYPKSNGKIKNMTELTNLSKWELNLDNLIIHPKRIFSDRKPNTYFLEFSFESREVRNIQLLYNKKNISKLTKFFWIVDHLT